MSDKNKVDGLIPYKIKNGEIFVFLQKKADNAKTLPGYFVFFGGKMEENETPEEAMKREIFEELNFTPEGYRFLDSYEFTNDLNVNIFILQVNNDFENRIKILEGEYGKFFGKNETLNEIKLTEEGKTILRDFYKLLQAQ